MHIKRFEAATLAEALREIRESFGPDALVLSTRSVRRQGSWFGRFARPVVEVTAAVDRELRSESREPARVAPDASWRELQLTRALLDPLELELRGLRAAVERLERQPERPLAEEVREIRRLAAELARREAVRGAEPGDRETQRLLAAGIAARHAAALGQEARRREGEGALVEALAARLDPKLRPPREDDPAVELFVGPTGVGKTTTLAKVAGREALPPALLTTDAHRLGAEAPLRGYARAIDARFDVAVSPEALRASLDRLGRSRVLVDTAGHGPADPDGLGTLRALRAALGRRVRVQLVLSATTKERDLAAQLERYRCLDPDGLVVTKLDESSELGSVVNLLLDGGTPPLAWLADGQRVPEDLHLPDPRTLARQVLGGGLA